MMLRGDPNLLTKATACMQKGYIIMIIGSLQTQAFCSRFCITALIKAVYGHVCSDTFLVSCLYCWVEKYCHYSCNYFVRWHQLLHCIHHVFPYLGATESLNRPSDSSWGFAYVMFFHMQKLNIPWTLKTAGALNTANRTGPRTISSHTTYVLLYSSLAGMCKKWALPSWWVVIPAFSSNNSDPLTNQITENLVALELQLKVAVDPSVALTDEGVLTKAGIKTMSVTHSLIPRPSPSFPSLEVPYCKRQEAGRGPGNEAK